jgi:hypothetical protein
MVAAVSVALGLVMTLAWLIWRRTENSGWVDATWTFGLGAIGVAGALTPALTGSLTERQILVAAIIACWSLRLGLHIVHRTARIVDDPRYAKLLRAWGADAPWQMFLLLQKQALVSIPLGVSMVIAAWNPTPGLRIADFVGAAPFPRRSGKPRPHLRFRSVVLVAPSELFLRVVWLACLSADRNMSDIPVGVARAGWSHLHVLAPGLCVRHSAA